MYTLSQIFVHADVLFTAELYVYLCCHVDHRNVFQGVQNGQEEASHAWLAHSPKGHQRL